MGFAEGRSEALGAEPWAPRVPGAPGLAAAGPTGAPCEGGSVCPATERYRSQPCLESPGTNTKTKDLRFGEKRLYLFAMKFGF